MNLQYNQLTEDGKKMFDTMAEYEELVNPTPVKPEKSSTKLKSSADRFEVLRLRREIQAMIDNSKLVVRDTTVLVNSCATLEEYITSDAKVARTLHEKLIERLTRVLNDGEAFPT